MTEPERPPEPDQPARRRPTFDPLRAVSDVQRQAIDSASHIIGQFLEMTRRASTDSDPLTVPESAEPEPGFQQLRANAARAVDLYVELFQRTFESYADLTESLLRRRGLTVNSDGVSTSDPLTLEAVDGGIAEGELWLHNCTDATIGPYPVTASTLTAHDGGEIPAAMVTIAPRILPAVGPHQSSTACVRIDASSAPPGRYFGHLLTPRAALAVRLDVSG